MDLKFRTVYAAYCNGTHHKLAMDALFHLRIGEASRWRDMFVYHAKLYTEGSKAPDKEFKDFKNHVLHVRDNYWGGAPQKCAEWYGKFVDELKQQNWENAVYAAGVLSHYYTDPIQPFHTGQTDAENSIHRAAEWSISKSYKEIKSLIPIEAPQDFNIDFSNSDWLPEMVREGARFSNRYYESLIAQYNFDLGVVDPPAGLTDLSRRELAELIDYASRGFAVILDRAIEEAEVPPPDLNLTLKTLLSALNIPIYWVVKKIEDREEKKIVQNIYDELQETGTVEHSLPEDDRVIRDLHRKEILNLDEKTRTPRKEKDKEAQAQVRSEPGKIHTREDTARKSMEDKSGSETNRKPRFYLELSDDVEKAPSIGPKTADRLYKVGIMTVADLLNADPADIAGKLDLSYIKEETIADWQSQSRLMCLVPELRGHDVQILVACGHRESSDIAELDDETLYLEVLEFCGTTEGKRVLRGGREPDLEEINHWISLAKSVNEKMAA